MPGSTGTAGTPTAGAAGRRPTTSRRSRRAAGCILWAHDHHALLASHAALRTGGVTAATEDPTGGLIRRDADGAPEGVLLESATRFVTVHLPVPAQADLEADIATMARQCLALGVVACHDPGPLAPDPDLTYSFGAYAHLAETGRLPMRVHASLRADALETALAGGLRSGDVLGGDPAGRARIGWQKTLRRRLARIADRGPARGPRARRRPPSSRPRNDGACG